MRGDGRALVSRHAYSGERCSLYCIIKGEANNRKSCAFRQHQNLCVQVVSRRVLVGSHSPSLVFLAAGVHRRSVSNTWYRSVLMASQASFAVPFLARVL
jgi:hypothetical protein